MFKKILQKLGIIKKEPWYKKVLKFSFLKNLNKKQKVILIIILIILLVFLIYFLFFTKGAAKADWWSIDWHYRKPITITENSGHDLTDYPTYIDIDTASLI